MTSATLYREGSDLDRLLAELDAQHPGRVRVVEVSHPREGGVFGFFARQRVAVHYQLDQPGESLGESSVQPSAGAPGQTFAESLGRSLMQASAESPAGSPATDNPLAALIAAAEAAEAAAAPGAAGPGEAPRRRPIPTNAPRSADGAPDEATDGSDSGSGSRSDSGSDSGSNNVEFARMLLDMAARKSLRREEPAEPAPAPLVPVAVQPATVSLPAPATVSLPAPATVSLPAPATVSVAARPVATGVADEPAVAFVPAELPPVTASHIPEPVPWQPHERVERVARASNTVATSVARPRDTDERLALRRQLAEIGVPFDWIPADAAHRYAAVEQLVDQLPAVPELPVAPGSIVVVVGPAPELPATAETLRARLQTRAGAVWTAGEPAGESTAGDGHIADAWQAAAVAAEHRLTGEGPALVLVPTDGLDVHQQQRAADLVRALSPDAVWAHVDATRKASDTARQLAEIGAPTALVVTGAQRTASPASVWDTGLPVALLDGQSATRSAWAVLLLDRLDRLVG